MIRKERSQGMLLRRLTPGISGAACDIQGMIRSSLRGLLRKQEISPLESVKEFPVFIHNGACLARRTTPLHALVKWFLTPSMVQMDLSGRCIESFRLRQTHVSEKQCHHRPQSHRVDLLTNEQYSAFHLGPIPLQRHGGVRI